MHSAKTHKTNTPSTRRFAVAPLLLAVGLGATACGSTDGAPAATGLTAHDAFQQARASALCERFARCGEMPGEDALTAGNLRNRAACVRVVGDWLRDPALVAALARGVIRYDAAAAERCVARLRATCPLRSLRDLDACREAYVGSLAVGAACTTDTECQPGNTCERTGSCGGTCRPAGARGAPCGTKGTSFACAHPAGGIGHCGSVDEGGGPSVCTHYRVGAPASQGMPCGVTPGASATEFVITPCAIGLACGRTMRGEVCQPLAAVGAPCGEGGVVCEAGAICAPSTGRFTCEAATVRTRAGEPCGGRTRAVCDPTTLFCNDDGMGVCVSPGAGSEGSACTPGQFGAVVCAPGLVCDEATRTCTRPAADGQPCREGSNCASHNCDSLTNTCVPGCR